MLSEEAEAANISPGAVLKSFPIGISTGLGWRPSGLLGVRGEQAHGCRRHDLLQVKHLGAEVLCPGFVVVPPMGFETMELCFTKLQYTSGALAPVMIVQFSQSMPYPMPPRLLFESLNSYLRAVLAAAEVTQVLSDSPCVKSIVIAGLLAYN